MLVPPPRVVRTLLTGSATDTYSTRLEPSHTHSVPGVSACMIAAPCPELSLDDPCSHTDAGLTVIAPRICTKDKSAPRRGVSAPTSTIPSDTAGLNRPPETRKKIHAVTISAKPKQRAMKRRLEVLTVAAAEPSCPSVVEPVTDVVGMRATLRCRLQP
jgi:hypothetical protein